MVWVKQTVCSRLRTFLPLLDEGGNELYSVLTVFYASFIMSQVLLPVPYFFKK